ncbi:MAG: alpha-amylase family glycosyl hydrolase [Prevotella sp.]|nr:alpha-amylase family glycosyl hydrolase [Prevotella sp.]
MKRFYSLIIAATISLYAMAQGWPANYGGVMLQGFYWDSFDDSQWSKLESQADELSQFFNLIWVPQSGKCLETYNTMGYTPYYYFNQNSSFGSESQLRSMISTFKSKGLGTIADVVVNHHNTNGWFGFPAEVYNGVTYQFLPTDITSNDDGGATATQAAKDGVALSQNKDEGEDWSGMRDLDHNSANVKTIVKAYEKYLLNDLGYTGFRYDMVKGFSASHVGEYNTAAGVEYSVGEYWDSNSNIENWINGTGKRSAAFDFQFRYNVRDAFNNGSNLTALNSTNNLMHDANYRQYAVTFVENHDTEYRSASAQQDPLKKDTLAANAYLMAMPGTPCVFFKHWKAYKQDIKAMILARKAAGIVNTSTYTNLKSTPTEFINSVTGNKGSLIVRFSSLTPMPSYSNDSYVKILSGMHYEYYLSKSTNTAWIDKASGNYTSTFKATLTAVTASTGAKLVYTTDGTTPSATNGTVVSSGTSIDITTDCTLMAGLLLNGTVSGITSRDYTISIFNPYEIKIYVNADNSGWNTTAGINFWTWGGDGSHAPKNSSWPGDKVTSTETVNGKSWFVKSFTVNSADDFVSFVVSTGTGSPQTVDVNGIFQTSYFEISAEKDTNSKYLVNDVTPTTGINNVTFNQPLNSAIYTIDGRRVNIDSPEQLGKGIYIRNGKKFVVK